MGCDAANPVLPVGSSHKSSIDVVISRAVVRVEGVGVDTDNGLAMDANGTGAKSDSVPSVDPIAVGVAAMARLAVWYGRDEGAFVVMARLGGAENKSREESSADRMRCPAFGGSNDGFVVWSMLLSSPTSSRGSSDGSFC